MIQQFYRGIKTIAVAVEDDSIYAAPLLSDFIIHHKKQKVKLMFEYRNIKTERFSPLCLKSNYAVQNQRQGDKGAQQSQGEENKAGAESLAATLRSNGGRCKTCLAQGGNDGLIQQ